MASSQWRWRSSVWLLAAGTALSALLALREIERLVGIAAVDDPATGGAFTVSELTRPLGGEQRVERLTSTWTFSDDLASAPSWIAAYLVIDLVFVVAYSALLWKLLRLVGSTARLAAIVAGLVLGMDVVETAYPLFVACGAPDGVLACIGGMSTPAAWGLVVLSTAKWVTLGVALLVVAGLWWSSATSGPLSRQRALGSAGRFQQGDEQPLWQALTPIWVVVALFVLLVGVPGGGPLTQFPDVLRAQIEGSSIDTGWDWPQSIWVVLPSTALLVVLLVSVVVAAGWATWHPTQASGQVSYLAPLAVAAVVSLAMVGAGALDDGVGLAAAAPFAVFAVVAAAGKGVSCLRGNVGDPSVTPPNGTPAPPPNGTPAPPPNGTPAPPPPPEPDNASAWAERRPGWVGVLAAVVVVAGGLGLQRAALTPVLVGVEADVVLLGSYTAWLAFAVAVTTVGAAAAFVLVAAVTEVGVPASLDDARGWWIWGHRVWLFVVAGLAVWLAVWPQTAHWGGTTGAVAVGLSVLVLLVGGLVWLSRHQGVWQPIHDLRLGSRSPWLVMVIVVWLVADWWQADGYHDARTTPVRPSDVSLETRVDELVEAVRSNTDCVTGTGADARVPLLLVAAPGGGIRAAYWTGVVLDRLLDNPACADSLVAASGVSGGSVGLTTRLLLDASKPSQPVLASMADDSALAADVAGLLLRDLPRPLTATTTPWPDRAQLHEQAWIDAEGAPFVAPTEPASSCKPSTLAVARSGAGGPLVGEFTIDDIGCPWAGEGSAGGPPIVMLNASSINDGCRLVSSNVDRLSVTTPSLDCLSSRTSSTGALTATHDATNHLGPGSRDQTAGDEPTGRSTSLPAVTGALLSARYPVVSPTGALVQDGRRLYATDGGLYENTGLLSLLELWGVMEPVVAENNREATTRGVTRSMPLIEPWIVMVPSGPASLPALDGNPSRPGEVGGPLRALLNRVSAAPLSTAGLSQAASVAMRGPIPGTTVDSGTRFAVLQPSADQSITAPLGWVLAPSTRAALDAEADRLLQAAADDPAARLARLLKIP